MILSLFRPDDRRRYRDVVWLLMKYGRKDVVRHAADESTSLTIFDYPAIAIIFFFLAAIGGGLMLFNIFFQDEKIRKKEGSMRP